MLFRGFSETWLAVHVEVIKVDTQVFDRDIELRVKCLRLSLLGWTDEFSVLQLRLTPGFVKAELPVGVLCA